MALGSIEGRYHNYYLVAVVLLAALSVALGIHFKRFAFVAYGMVYGYGAISVRVVEKVRDPIAGFLYFIVTGGIVLVALVAIARRFGRDE